MSGVAAPAENKKGRKQLAPGPVEMFWSYWPPAALELAELVVEESKASGK